ncbi:hypothetical protein EON83_22935 [bacterium]|nr:MAG: hypothetical protein EON83_22935 [bacterium]
MHDFTRAEGLVAEIERVFADTRGSSLDEVVPYLLADDWEGREVQAAFAGKTWADISLDLLIRNNVYLLFLSEEAQLLFLPGLMVASLSVHGVYEVAPPLMRAFSPRPYGQLVGGMETELERDKCAAVYQYVRFLADEFADVFNDEAHIELTVGYWRGRCE